MSKKVKCAECKNFTCWALPEKVYEKNYDYVKRCLNIAKHILERFAMFKYM